MSGNQNYFTSKAINIDSVYRMAHALDEPGNHQDSLVWYQKFLDFWGEADREIPTVLKARKRVLELDSQ